jgi:hypothetical protein
MLYSSLSSEEQEQLWKAPEGHEYSVQYRNGDCEQWYIYNFALYRKEAIEFYNDLISNSGSNAEYRIVKLSRYPPCSVTEVVKYKKG